MIVITLTDCPPKLRGDLSKWLCEINTGVYVGHASPRVRDELWKRICQNLRSGRATMVFSARNEQQMDFRVHNSAWVPIDFDGLKLMLRPSPARLSAKDQRDTGFSAAARYQKARRVTAASQKRSPIENYVVIDIETTGLSSMYDEIIEIAALRVENSIITDKMSLLVKPTRPIPPAIAHITGITDEVLSSDGVSLKDGLERLLSFAGNERIIAYNAAFDYAFIRATCQRTGLPPISNQYIDLYQLSKRRVDEVENYKLTTLAKHFGIDTTGAHRSLKDCQITKLLYEKLNEI